VEKTKEIDVMNDAIEDGAVCGPEACGPMTQQSERAIAAKAPASHHLIVVSDVICPWCFMAKRNLEKALQILRAKLPVEITWSAFELNPEMPKDGMDRHEYRSKKFGSWNYSQSLDAQVAEAGASAGITFRHDLIARTPNTFNAHRLIWLGQKEGVQDAVVESLFRAYFTQGQDVGDIDVLVGIATQSGIAQDRARAFIESTDGTDVVRRDAQMAIACGISAVPTFIFDGHVLFSGALKPAPMAERLLAAAVVNAKR
jgi:predicted DsbA family dithiol-disulfide isomerase